MARVVSLFLPTWSTDRVRKRLNTTTSGTTALPPDSPLVLAGHDGGRRLVLATDGAARRLGLRTGMTVAHVQALHPGLTILPADPQGDTAALHALGLWLQQRLAPIVGLDPPDGLVLDTTGTDHLHGGEAAMLTRLADRLRHAGLCARLAIADNWGAAHAIARYGPEHLAIVPPGANGHALSPLPIEGLRLDAATLDGLHALGLSRIGDLARRPRAPLALRFGPTVTLRLDQACGARAEAIVALRPVDPVAVTHNLGEPIAAAETIARYITMLTTPFCAALEARGQGARRVDLLLHRVDNHCEVIRIALSRPMRDVARLARLLCDRIETITPGFGIERLELIATLAEPLDGRQTEAALAGGDAEASPDLPALLDTLANHVGADALYRCAAIESDVPERSVRRVAPLGPASLPVWPVHWPRPERLLPHPEPVRTLAVLPDHPPRFFVWRGKRHDVRCADGPERVFGEWWRDDRELTAARDYFRVEDMSGGRYWLYRAGDGEHGETGTQAWFLHGIFA
ncbi:protein ImuB [Ameyamaea chiangmaiensis NBRC 103196]|uniref:DNA-directed DNA polymerase n=1 Tax=Ameyamaea chiangmaiensis TaxID=442969 RepID=A0A850PFV3_9PROT|nr:DUF6504 family protein [Ameyamaea chiangmaiensis]MBS4075522.1 DNA polymerase Y family protein [Ameyamaea chiangmaiensis]NVN41519.1 DNA polymerase Y family protein [Ameyamaea chiangmaiensis]GBQ69444.1 protein ImuB [Ameyamaea chiangmaiensis NBRC 103196]